MEMPPADLRDIISCPICYEDFEEPKALPCLHTFCKECLQLLILKSMESDVKKYFFCPSCRRKVYGPKNVALEEWADSFPSNHTIRTLQDNFKMEDSESMCDYHKGRVVEYYCTDHETTICSQCFVLEHRQCCEVDTVEAAADKTRDKESELEEKLRRLAKWMDKKKSKRREIHTRLIDVEAAVRSWRKEVDEELDQWESHVTEQLQTVAAKDISQLEQAIQHGEHIMHNLKNAKTDICDSTQSNKRILKARTSISSVISEATEVINSVDSDNSHFQLSFKGNESLKKSLSGIGSLVVPQTTVTSASLQKNLSDEAAGPRIFPSPTQLAQLVQRWDTSRLNPNATQFIPKGNLNVRTSRDKDDCLITGSTFLPDGILAITDQNNGKIKFFGRSFNLLSEMGFSSDPWDVCYAGGNAIAVSFPDDNFIQFFKIKGGKITGSMGNVKTPGRCYGIDIRGQRLAFICRSRQGSSVHVVNRTEGKDLGTWIKEKAPTLKPGGMWYLAFDDNGDILYVTDDEDNRLITLAVDGSHGTSLRVISTQDFGNYSTRGVATRGPDIVVTSPTHVEEFSVYSKGLRSQIYKARGDVVSVDPNTNRIFISPPSKGQYAKSNICQVRHFDCSI
ncbi:E3 ubiquitin-protein ligase TRIM34B-like [Ylistrum balloti]|uniref:E3 ubiquitin-protein ligase TRIM34B-like n=1 Tax=Ylistrum balloti TaxID=509963 RepID=UPI0029058E53|nr:E3 ubiquitin-protein ligase TRIM34B-like [Ylistrum balloti]